MRRGDGTMERWYERTMERKNDGMMERRYETTSNQ